MEKDKKENQFDFSSFIKSKGLILFDLLLILLWGLWIGKEYLDFNPLLVPAGNEYGSVVASHHFWNAVKDCGWCALWDGTIQGGIPAFADIYTGVFHPVTMLTTWLWGVVNGSKAILIGSIWTAGLAQYWLSKELKLTRPAKIWSTLLVMAGGHLAGRMEGGLVNLVLSTAMCSLVFSAVLMVSRRKDFKASIILGFVLASAILSGQGYIQVGVLMTIPAILFLNQNAKMELQYLWKKYLLAAVLALLLSAPLLVPFLRTSSQISKYTDPEFIHIQPIQYAALNLVIDDLEFFRSTALSKFPYPNLYINYIGWIPVLFAVFGFAMRKDKDKHKINYLFSSVLLVFLFVTPQFFQWLIQFWQGLEKIRLPSYILGIVATPILGLAGYGLDRILEMKWTSILFDFETPIQLLKKPISLKWLLVLPLIISLNQALQFSRSFYYTNLLNEDMFVVLDKLETEDNQWVQTPFGEHFWIEPAVNLGYKLSPGIKPWRLKNNEPPTPYLEVTRNVIDSDPDNTLINETLPNVLLYKHDLAAYATIQRIGDPINCHATGRNGSIELVCPDQSSSGRLIVKENYYSGWKAWAGDKELELVGEDWLEIVLIPGVNKYRFQYLPWDVPLGITLMLIGFLFSIYLFKKDVK